MRWAIIATGWLLLTLPGSAQSEGLLFSASFDRWLIADVAAGGRVPIREVGKPSLAPGKHGQALALDGASYLEFPAGANVGRTACTICLWFLPGRWGARQYDNILGLSDSNLNALHLERADPGGQLRIVLGGPGTAENAQTRSMFSRDPLRDGQWVHIAVAWDAPKERADLFLDGRPAAELSGPGAFPLDPASILVGCGYGRLGRAITGLIDDLVVLDHAATQEEVHTTMEGVARPGADREIRNSAVTCLIDRTSGSVTLASLRDPSRPCVIGPGAPYARVMEDEVVWPSFDSEERAEPIAASLGAAEHHVFVALEGARRLGLRYHVQAQRDLPMVLVWAEVTNRGEQPVKLSDIGLLRCTGPAGLALGGPDRLRVFTDSGGLTGSGTRTLSVPSAEHAAHGALVIADPEDDWACSLSFVTFRTASVTSQVVTDDHGQPESAKAVCAYPGGFTLKPGETLESEVLLFGIYPSGHDALERWADVVMAANGLAPPKHCPSGWNSWYAYRLTLTEDIALANARIVKERFAPLGCTNIQLDHGWEYRDVVGNWVPNDRFPHGMNWLHDQLAGMGLTLGLWVAVTQVSEFAPLFSEHPEALLQGANGKPLVTDPNWYWEPHGRCFSLDPTHPLGEELYRRSGEMLREYGCTYVKNDFQGNLLQTGLPWHDADPTRGVPAYRKAMAAFREGMGPDMAYHACNAPLNVAAGLCDVAWVHRDLGNPAGNWEHLRLWANEFACRYHVSGKFYWSDPDYLQVGQGDLNETRVRMALVALGGGPAFLSDRLPDLPEDRLALIPKCLPSYRQTARPLDLFEHDGYPQVWDLPVETSWGKWHVVGLLNLDEAAARITVDLRRLGLEEGRPCLVYDFFEEKLLGEVTPSDDMVVALRFPVPATSVRLLRIVRKEPRPFVLSTDMHLTQGGVELRSVEWNERRLTLTGVARRAAGMSGRVFVYVPEGYAVAKGGTPPTGRVLAVPVSFRAPEAGWSVRFARA
jgi:Concanavalin A-like lectin/glucanases superfamily